MKTIVKRAPWVLLCCVSAAKAECDPREVRWLQSQGYSPREAMDWCAGTAPSSARNDPAPRTEPVLRIEPAVAPAPSPFRAPQLQKVADLAPANAPLKISAAPALQAPAGGGASGDGNDLPTRQLNALGQELTTFADTAKAAQGKTTTKEDNSSVDPLAKFKVSSASGSRLVTAHIATSFTPAFLSTTDGTSWKSRIGMDISASVPAESVTLQQYAKHALLTLDGGILNIYGSPAGRDPKVYPPKLQDGTPDGTPNPRESAWDHLYMIREPAPGQTSVPQEQLLGYWKMGIGGRAIKKSLEGSEYAGIGTAYLGVGFDGPMFSGRDSKRDGNTGWFSIEAYGVANIMNKGTLTTLFEQPNEKRNLNSVGAKVAIGLPGRFFLSATYGKALGSFGRDHIKDIAVVSFGYNPEVTTEDTKKDDSTPKKKKAAYPN